MNQSLGTQALDGNLLSLTVDILDAWNSINGALQPTDSKLRKDWETLDIVSGIAMNLQL